MGRHVFGFAALLLGAAALSLHDQLVSEWQLAGTGMFLIVTSVLQIIGGAALLVPRTSRAGAMIAGVSFLACTLTLVPDIFAQPGVYYTWGNVFYGLSLVAGAMVVAGIAPRAAIIVLGLSSISFAFEQIEFFARTVSLVPHWIPPNGAFWTWFTTAAFALAGISLIINYRALLAAQLLAFMVVFFGVAIWIPILIADHKTHMNWSEGIETFAIGGATWIVADHLLRRSRRQRLVT